jgi:hypothetical protein
VHNFASIGMSDIATYPFWYTVAWADLLRSLGFGLQPRFNPKAQVPMVISRGFGGSVLHIQLQMLWYYGARNTWQRRIEGRQRPTDAFTRLMAERRAAEQAGARPPPLPTFAATQEVRGSPAPARCARGAVNARLKPRPVRPAAVPPEAARAPRREQHPRVLGARRHGASRFSLPLRPVRPRLPPARPRRPRRQNNARCSGRRRTTTQSACAGSRLTSPP